MATGNGWTKELENALYASGEWLNNGEEEGPGDYVTVGPDSVYIWSPCTVNKQDSKDYGRHPTKWIFDASEYARRPGGLPTDVLFDSFETVVMYALVEVSNRT